MDSHRYQFFIITSIAKPTRFEVVATNMKDWRLRASALKSHYRKYKKDALNYKPVFDIFDEQNHTAYYYHTEYFYGTDPKRLKQQVIEKTTELSQAHLNRVIKTEVISGPNTGEITFD